jgi:hypothetical protein
MGHGLGLAVASSGPLEVLDAQGARVVGDSQALLTQRREAHLAESLSPARQRGAVEGLLVPEHMLAAEILKVGVLDPVRAEGLVAQRMHVLQDEQSRHQPHRQWRLAVGERANLGQTPLLESPVDLPGQRASGWAMSMIRSSPGRNRSGCRSSRGRAIPTPRCRIDERIESGTAQKPNPKWDNTASATALSCKNLYFPAPTKPASSTPCRFFTGD